MYEWKSDALEPKFDQELASSYIGKYILVGISYFDSEGGFIEQVQMHRIIDSVSSEGLKIALQGTRNGETWIMPPNIDSVIAADPGVYSLRSTGEQIENPDLLSTWNVTMERRK